MSTQEISTIRIGLSQVGPKLERVEKIDDRLHRIKKEEKAASGLLPREEVADRLVKYLTQERERFERSGFSASSTGGTQAMEIVGNLSYGRPRPIRFAPNTAAEDCFSLVLWLLGDDLEARARAALARTPFQSGLGAKERTELHAKLDAERAALVEEREQLVEDVRAAGVPVEHLPETAQAHRRAAALAAAEEAARLKQERAERLIEQRERGR